MYKVKTLNNISPSSKEVLNENEYEMSDTVADPDALFVRASDLHDYPWTDNIKCIGRAGIGVNTIPLEECASKGIVVFNTPGGNANAVKEQFLFGITAASRNLIGAINWVNSYQGEHGPIEAYMEKIKKQFVGPEFYGKTLGVVGTGNVGSLVANVALDLGMKVYAYDPYLSVDAAWKVSRRVFRVSSLNDLFKHVDYLTLHTPLTDETRGMIGKEQIAMMKDGVRIINYARGEVVDEDAMIEALNSGKVARFVADFPTEKMCKAPNAVLTPHLGGTTYEAESNCARMAAEEIDDCLKNGNIKNSVNLPNVTLERSGMNRICLIHKNIPGMLTNIMPVFSKDGINIENMTNKSRGEFAYSVFDVNSEVNEKAVEELKNLDGMIRVRVL